MDQELDEIRRRRIFENERLFRSANEARQAEAIRYRTPPRAPLDLICECGEISCVERISVPLEEYVRIHGDPRRYVIRPGHELAEFERVVEEREGYTVVEKPIA